MIDCAGAWTDSPDHSGKMRKPMHRKLSVLSRWRYPDIVKVIAVGNEAMVHWAASYFGTRRDSALGELCRVEGQRTLLRPVDYQFRQSPLGAAVVRNTTMKI